VVPDDDIGGLTKPDALGVRRQLICTISGLGLISAPSGWK